MGLFENSEQILESEHAQMIPSAPKEDNETHFNTNDGTTGDEEEEHNPSVSIEAEMIAESVSSVSSAPNLPPAIPVPIIEETRSHTFDPTFYDDYDRRDYDAGSPNSFAQIYREARLCDEEDSIPSPHVSPAYDFEYKNVPERSNMVASGVAGAVVGTLLIGTFPGLIAGFYSAYATRQRGAAGDIARAMGEVALITREKAIVIDQKHHLVVRGKILLKEMWEHAKELDRTHHILRKLRDFSLFSWSLTLDFVSRKRLVQRAFDSLGMLLKRIDTPASSTESPFHQSSRGELWQSGPAHSSSIYADITPSSPARPF